MPRTSIRWLTFLLLALLLPALACGLDDEGVVADVGDEVIVEEDVVEEEVLEGDAEVGEATTLIAGESVEATLTEADSTHTYRFEVPAGATIEVAVQQIDEGSSMEAVLYREGQPDDPLTSDLVFFDDPAELVYQLDAAGGGTYVLQVVGGPAHYRVQIALTEQAEGDAGGDAADSPANATPITIGTTYAGRLGGEDGADWYAVEVPSGAAISLFVEAVEEESASVEVNVYRAGALDTPLTFGSVFFDDPAELDFRSETTGAGAYLIEVTGGGSDALAYYELALNAGEAAEGEGSGDAADEPESATPIELDKSYVGALGDDDVNDFYRIPAVAGEPLLIAVGIAKEDSATVQAILLKDGNQVVSDVAFYDDDALISLDRAEAGTYVLAIGSGGLSAYTFTVTQE
ncbi:MAG: hypothetical protein R3272_00845 [Candidatus Promineifilaceae bacterium]|nr:hypothetical protein [Candidatus Promineifilaceae bacterium]